MPVPRNSSRSDSYHGLATPSKLSPLVVVIVVIVEVGQRLPRPQQ